MIYISLPNEDTRRLSFYLALEEFVARRLNEQNDCFFIWQVPPSVIFGRNQLIENEVNLDYCRAHGIQTYRRKSGGGCVYADMGNVMFSYITCEESVSFTFHRYIQMVTLMLRDIGVPAVANGRNDILIGERKVSGNAFYHVPGHSIVHGTMLYDTDMQHMVGAITPSGEKLLSKGVQSVRQHIALLKDYTDMPLDDFKRHVRQRLCGPNERCLTDDEVAEVEHIEREYLSTAFIYGHNPRYTLVRKGRIEGVGELEMRMEVKNNVIRSANLMGDFFLVGDMDAQVLRPLCGVPLQADLLAAALPEHLDEVIHGLQREQLVALIMGL